MDQAIRLYRRNFLKFVGIIACVQIPLTLLSLFVSLLTLGDTFARLQGLTSPSENPFDLLGPGYFIGMAASLVLTIINVILINGVATAALTRAVADHYLGESTTFTDAYVKIGRSWLRLVGALLLAILLSIVLFIWFLVPCIGWLTGVGMLTLFWTTIVPLIAPIIVLENRPAAQSIRRAWDLVRRRFWWVIGFVAILFLFNQIVVSGPAYLINLLFQFLAESLTESTDLYTVYTIQTASQSLIAMILGLVYFPLQLTCMTLMYFDLRVRTEGFDLTLLAASVSSSQADTAAIVAQVPPLETKALVTRNELGYFVLLSVAVFALYFALGLFVAMLGLAGMAVTGGLPGP